MKNEEMEKLAQAVLERITVPLEASARHVHLTQAQAQALFGHDLTQERELSQPGQFLARERVRVEGPKGKLENVAVLGPARKAAQIEISLTDGRVLGITPPVRLSGDTKGSPGCTLTGERGSITVTEGVIAAKRHIHLHPDDARRLGVSDCQEVSLQTLTGRSVIFEAVSVRVSENFSTAAHLDFDEANACGFAKGDRGRILL
jgi:propanediol utilization protein